jgi:hypothetical protein
MNTGTTSSVLVDINQGEVKVIFKEVIPGKVSFRRLGLSDFDLTFNSGLIRMVFEMEETNGNRSFCHMPTIEVQYKEMMGETHWICEFNGKTILDKLDHQGRSTVMLMDRSKIVEEEHHHKNTLIMHAEFPQGVHLDAEASFIKFFN